METLKYNRVTLDIKEVPTTPDGKKVKVKAVCTNLTKNENPKDANTLLIAEGLLGALVAILVTSSTVNEEETKKQVRAVIIEALDEHLEEIDPGINCFGPETVGEA